MSGTRDDPIDLTAPAAEAPPPAGADAVILFGAKHPPVPRPTAAEGKARVHELVSRFHLDPDSVDALLVASKDIIAGGAMLHAYMGQPADAFTTDLDIFSAGYANRPFKPRADTMQRTRPDVLAEIRTENEMWESSGYEHSTSGILQVLDFVRAADRRKVQVIVCLVPKSMPEGFDLSAAATVWDGRTLQTAFPWITRRWLTFWQCQKPAPAGPRHSPERLRKYEEKGFHLLPDGGKYIEVDDDYAY